MTTTTAAASREGAEDLFAWTLDAERLGREVATAELNGKRDDLTLAEIECSLDLIDAELAAFKNRRHLAPQEDPKVRELQSVRAKLSGLARRLARLNP